MKHIRTAAALLFLVLALVWPPIAAVMRYAPRACCDMREDYRHWWLEVQGVYNYWKGDRK